jgi:5-methylcytosine-specific restriction endonuclease McrA
MPPRVTDAVEAARIVKLYVESRMSLREVGAEIGRDHHYVARRLTESGVVVSRGNKRRLTVTVGAKAKYEITCAHCGTARMAYMKAQRHCSPRCRGAAQRAGAPHHNRKPRDQRTCARCGDAFQCAPSEKHKHCSRRCFDLAHSERMAGSGNPAYVDGSSMEHVSFRGSDWDQIRRRAYVRDGYRCQVCGVKCISKASSTSATSRNVIQCHHKQKYKGPEDNDLSNLVTLCLGCHADHHHRAGDFLPDR